MAESPTRAELWEAAGAVARTVEVETAGGLRVFVHTWDGEIGRKVFVDGAFERDVLLRADAALAQLDGAGFAGRTMIDIGANIGTASLHAVTECGASVAYAFEPNPDNYRLLKVNVAANDLEGVILTAKYALSDAPGRGWLELCGDNSGAHVLRYEEPSGESVKVECATFDGWLDQRGGPPLSLDRAFGWIDVEGSELRVLRGASSLLAVRAPLVMEYRPESLGHDAAPLRELLATHYRTWLDLRDPDATPQPTARLGELHAAVVRDRRVQTDVLVLA